MQTGVRRADRRLHRWLRTLNERLLAECSYRHIQAAVNDVTERGTTIYVLPGTYREEPSRAEPSPECARLEGRDLLTYAEQYACPNLQQLVAVFGDRTPDDDDHSCDSARCDLQLEGTGREMTDVVIEGGYKSDGTWEKLNGIRSDRADGFYLRNITTQLFEFNGVYILEQTRNAFGVAPDGRVLPNGLDVWWDEQGDGNCWEDNTSSWGSVKSDPAARGGRAGGRGPGGRGPGGRGPGGRGSVVGRVS